MKDMGVLPSTKDDKKKKKSPDDWEIKNWTDTVMEAHRIMKDPKKMKHVAKNMHKDRETINSVQGLRDRAKQVAAEETEEVELPPAKKTTKKEVPA